MLPDFLKQLMMGSECKNFEEVRSLTQEERTRFLELEVMRKTIEKTILEYGAKKKKFWANIEISTEIYDKMLRVKSVGKGQFSVLVHKCEEEH